MKEYTYVHALQGGPSGFELAVCRAMPILVTFYVPFSVFFSDRKLISGQKTVITTYLRTYLDTCGVLPVNFTKLFLEGESVNRARAGLGPVFLSGVGTRWVLSFDAGFVLGVRG